MDPTQIAELKKALEEIQKGGSTNAAAEKALQDTIAAAETAAKKTAEDLATLQKESGEMTTEFTKMKKIFAQRGQIGGTTRL